MSRLVISSLEQRVAQLKVSSQAFSMCQLSRKPPCVQCIRYYRPRKPFWLPVAKSKMFRFHKKPVIPKEEEIELSRLYNVYRTQMKSLNAYFKEQLMSQTTAPEVIEERKQRQAEQHAACIRENELWNAEVGKLREVRLAKEAIIREEKILGKIMEHEIKQNALMEEINVHIRKEKEAAKTFITPGNIDEAIKSALATVVDHNFCIDVECNVYKGRYGKPTPSPTDKKPSTVQPSPQQDKTVSLEAVN